MVLGPTHRRVGNLVLDIVVGIASLCFHAEHHWMPDAVATRSESENPPFVPCDDVAARLTTMQLQPAGRSTLTAGGGLLHGALTTAYEITSSGGSGVASDLPSGVASVWLVGSG